MSKAAAAGGAWTRDTVLLLAGLMIVALALRLPSLDDALFADELSTHFIVHGFGVDNLINLVRSDSEVTPPLWFVLAWLSKGVGGFEALRLPALLAGLASIPVIYLLGLRTVGPRAAMVAAALMALSPFQIFYATEARSYAVAMLLGMLATLALLKASESERASWWVAFALAAAAAVYTHYSAIFLMVGLFGWAFFARPRARRGLLIASAAAALLFAPWLPEYVRDSEAPNGAKLVAQLNPVTLSSVKTDLGHWGFGHPFTPVADVPSDLALLLIAAGFLLGAIGLLLRKRGIRGLWPPSEGILLVAVLASSAAVGALLYALVSISSDTSVFGSRYLIVSWPGLALAMAALVCAGRGALRVAAVALLLGGFAIGAIRMLDEDNQRPDFVAAAEFIEERGRPDSPVVDLPQPTPGPTTNLETALAGIGKAVPEDRSVLALGYPSYEDRIESRRTDGPDGVGGVQVGAPLPIPSATSLADRAVREAGSGPIFIVSGDAPLDFLAGLEGQPVAEFLAALPPRYREVESRRFPGLWITPIRVHVLEPEPG